MCSINTESGVSRCSCKTSALDTFAISTRKHLFRSLLLKKLLAHQKETPTQLFSCGLCFKNTYFEGPLQVAVNDNSK